MIVTFEEKVEGCARVWATRTCSDTGPSGPYTRTRHMRVIKRSRSGMAASRHTISLYLGYAKMIKILNLRGEG